MTSSHILSVIPDCLRSKGNEPDLVDLNSLHSGFRLDIRYATVNNFVRVAVYKTARAILQRPAAEALVRVAKRLESEGYGLLIYDAYRPWFVTDLFWKLTPPELHDFVANPECGSKHNRGCAVDLSMYRLSSKIFESGLPEINTVALDDIVEMPCDFDDMTDKAHSEYTGDASLAFGSEAYEREQASIRMRDMLRFYMELEGFTVQPNEWWHFNYKDWELYPILNIPFESIPHACVVEPLCDSKVEHNRIEE